MKLLYTHTEAVDAALKDISRSYKHMKMFCDLGCGVGYRTMLFNEYGRNVTGIDINNYKSLDYNKFNFVQGDIFKSKLPSKKFDIVFNCDVIEHLEKPELLLKEIRRIMKDNGICILSTPNRYRLMNAISLLFRKRTYPYCIDLEHKDEYPEYWHITEFSYWQLKGLLKKYGFKIISHYKIYYGLPSKLGLKSFFGFPFYHNHVMVLALK